MAKKTKKEEVTIPEITLGKKELAAIAKELNKVLGLDPAIDVKAPQEDLVAKINEAATLLIPEDELSAKTMEGLGELGIELPMVGPDSATEDTEDDESGEDEEEDQEDEEQEDEEEEDEEEDEEEVPASKKPKKYPIEKKKAPADEPTPAEKPEKKAKPAKETKPKTESNRGGERTELGHAVNSQAGKIDEVLLKYRGKALEVATISEESGCTPARIKSHLKHLETKGYNIKIEGNTILFKK
jgi:outer membrane biosynthesis protein TonB